MKISFVSSQAIASAMRYQTQRMQAELTDAQKEVTTGRHADVGIAKGAQAGRSFSLAREGERLSGIIDSNELAMSRLSATQLGLQQISEDPERFMSDLTTAMSGAGNDDIIRRQASSVLDQVSSVLNSSLNGEYLFAGVNTDVRPIADFLEPGSANRVAFEDAFDAAFPDPSAITEDEMTDFLENTVSDQYFGAEWNNVWSSAADEQVVSRITLSETAETSVSANIDGVRKVMMATATIAAAFEREGLSDGAKTALMEKSFDLVGSAVPDLANQQSFTGVTEQRLENANERLSMQKDLFTETVDDIEGVDPYEASTRVSSLLTQIETSYALTARMQNLSLVRFLG